ncbi:MAG: class I SAM-dependent methyltransferase [Ignavibacteriaceae bacterium]
MTSAKINYHALFKDKSKVPAEFNKVAKKYDTATFLSQGYKKDLQRSVDRLELSGDEFVLDLCCGTGQSTICVLNSLNAGKVIGIDNSEEMLNIAKQKYSGSYKKNRLEFIKQDVMNINYEDESVDAIIMAYGIRNMPDYKVCIENLFRLLRPGGKIAFHEYSLYSNFLTHIYWTFLGHGVVIPISALISGSTTIYKYLVKSVLEFPPPDDFLILLKKAGFINVMRKPMPSWRKPILHTFLATKP